MDYLEFIARVTSHIPDKGQVMIRYYGLYSNAHRGKELIYTGLQNLPIGGSVYRMTETCPYGDWIELEKIK